MVIFNAGRAGLALNKDNGEKIWLSTTDPGGYATAVPFEMDGTKCIAYFGFQEILGIEAATGKVLWRYPWKTQHDVNAADPIISGDHIFISSGYGTGCALLKLEKIGGTRQPGLIWENKNMRNKMNACVLYNGYIYGVDEGGHLRCLDMKTGEKLWEQKGFGQGSLSIADGKLLVMGEDGTLVVAKTSPESYQVLTEAKVLPAKAWTVPVLANGKIFVRDEEGNAACFDVSM
jgi:outer membrane protein assembly factor BamB